MNQFAIRLIAGALTGFLSAVVVDVQKWAKTGGTFDWGIALRAWIAGAVTGALAGLGIGSVPEVGA